MQHLAVIVLIPDGDSVKPLAISPTDDIWFVDANDVPSEVAAETVRLLKGQGLEVAGHIFVGDQWTRK